MTGLTTNNGKAWADTDELQLQNLKADTIARLINGERYAILTTDSGSGLPLPNGNFANPVASGDPQTGVNTGNIATNTSNIGTNTTNISKNSDALFFDSISTPTNLVVGKKYLSTATATHVVPTAGNADDEIVITWLDGTIMTLVSISNISVTTDVKTTDTSWEFENFIQTLTLVDTGTEWEIK